MMPGTIEMRARRRGWRGVAVALGASVVVLAGLGRGDVWAQQNPADLAVLDVAESFGLELVENAAGDLVVQRVVALSPADLAGLEEGDRIIGIDQQRGLNAAAITVYLRDQPSGARVEVRLVRKGERLTKSVVAGPRRGDVPLPGDPRPVRRGVPRPARETALFGMVVAPAEDGRPVVRRVPPATPAAKAGFEAGDVLISVADTRIRTYVQLSEEATRLLDRRDVGQEVPVRVVRGDEEVSLLVTLPMASAPGAGTLPRSVAQPEVTVAVVNLRAFEAGSASGFITLTQDQGTVRIDGEIRGLPAGLYRLVIHETGDTGDLENGSAGEVYAPQPIAGDSDPLPVDQPLVREPLPPQATRPVTAPGGSGQRPRQTPDTRNAAGDLGTFEVPASGAAAITAAAPVTLTGPAPVLGRALLIHAQSARPAEGLGEVKAYGVIGIGHPNRLAARPAGVRGR